MPDDFKYLSTYTATGDLYEAQVSAMRQRMGVQGQERVLRPMLQVQDERFCAEEGEGMKAAIYVRVSTHDQTVEHQIAPCKRYCEQRGWDYDIYADQISGATTSRPEYIIWCVYRRWSK